MNWRGRGGAFPDLDNGLRGLISWKLVAKRLFVSTAAAATLVPFLSFQSSAEGRVLQSAATTVG